MPQSAPKSNRPPNLSSEKYQRLLAEAKAPYKGLRKFVYGAFGASGAIGAFAAGRDLGNAIPSFFLQIGVVALMVFLFRWENRPDK